MLEKLSPQKYIELAETAGITAKITTINNEPFLPTYVSTITYEDGSYGIYEYLPGRNEWVSMSGVTFLNEG